MITVQLKNELEALTQKIEQNSANLDDYKRYETILTSGGLSHTYIFSYLNRAGFRTWEEFIAARKKKAAEANTVGALIGLGLGILLLAALGEKE